jgi:hypothetical protein
MGMWMGYREKTEAPFHFGTDGVAEELKRRVVLVNHKWIPPPLFL